MGREPDRRYVALYARIEVRRVAVGAVLNAADDLPGLQNGRVVVPQAEDRAELARRSEAILVLGEEEHIDMVPAYCSAQVHQAGFINPSIQLRLAIARIVREDGMHMDGRSRPLRAVWSGNVLG